ncbi:MAG: hypothetical protein M3280_02265 [Actinomycetota bacterium]|nr:hypothetical protein [Actinomycetota bacterium]
MAIPNVSEGRDQSLVDEMVAAVTGGGARLLDVHSDPLHNRSVLTTCADDPQLLVAAMTELAERCGSVDLAEHSGIHARLGILDVCPFVPFEGSMTDAVGAAYEAGKQIAERAGIPVFLYGMAAGRNATRDLPTLRRGGLPGLSRRMELGLYPDFGPAEIDPHRGVVCVGARGPLIAFNVWFECDVKLVEEIARSIRTSDGGPPGVRALGLRMTESVSQVSMNLIEPEVTGIDDAFELVTEQAGALNVRPTATEIVGLVQEKWLPNSQKEAARLLLKPGRSIESALGR